MNFIYIYFDYKELCHLKSSDKPSHPNKIHIYFSIQPVHSEGDQPWDWHQRPLGVEPQQAERGGHVLGAAVYAVDRDLRQDPVVR